jgi:hypothetical protein
MRPIALNRKNSLFPGHDRGAENWEIVASFIVTCKLQSVNPQVWLTDVLTKLVNRWPASRIDELMPWAYANRCRTVWRGQRPNGAIGSAATCDNRGIFSWTAADTIRWIAQAVILVGHSVKVAVSAPRKGKPALRSRTS